MNKRIITKYKLRGRASKDGGRQYGTIKKLRNPERYKSYCVKDGKIHHNIDPKLIEEYISKSFKKKTTEIAIKISCREHIEAEIERYKAKRFKNRNNIDFMPLNDEGLIGYYAVKVSKFFRENGAKAPPSRSYVIYVLWKLEIISDQFYVSNILRL
ncbi:MAG TPA: hypothetical protein EYN64_00975 [Flavobacteriales bacterium]|nr:hypothetical protein [Flavobacteriales bacterium]